MSFNKKIILSLFVAVTLTAALALAYLHKDFSNDIHYVTSKQCQQCHQDIYNSWRENTLHPYMFLPVDSPDAKILGDFSQKNSVVTFSKDDIDFVVGSKWEQVYVKMIDGEYYPLPAKWYVMQNRWVPYKVDDWHKTKMSYKCNGCHTTGFDPETLKFAEFGIGCEACHGPSNLHVQHERQEHDWLCNSCHKDESEMDEAMEKHHIVKSVSPSVCGQCHSRGTTKEGNVVSNSQFNFPLGFKPGDDLRTTDFTPSTPKNDKNNKFWWGNGLSKNRHQEFSDWSQSKHAKSLEKLLAHTPEDLKKHGKLENSCLHCHSSDFRLNSSDKKPTLKDAKYGVSCVSCHEPHGSQKKRNMVSDGESICGNCHVSAMAKQAKQHFPCPYEKVSCADCHMPRIVKTGGFFSLRSHAFKIVKPTETIDSKMPNSCQNSGCHEKQDSNWMIKQYETFYGKE